MTPKTFRPRRIAAAVAAACTLATGHAWGAAFALQENSGSGLGNAFAGGAAFTEDASSMWSNAATLSKRGSMEAAAALHLITPSIKFRDDGSLPALNQPLGGTGGDAGGTNFVPNTYFAVPINRQWTFGIGINAPFGLKTEYDDGWLGRYQALLVRREDDQRQPGVLVQGERRCSRSASARTGRRSTRSSRTT